MHPLNQPFHICPKCGQMYDQPRIGEDDDLTMLNLFCPECGYHFARWPKSEGEGSVSKSDD